MVYTVDQFLNESKKYPITIEMDGLYVPVDVGLFLAAAKISGAQLQAIYATQMDYQGSRILVLTNITWDTFLQTSHSTKPN